MNEEHLEKLAEVLEYHLGGPKGTEQQRERTLKEIDTELEALYARHV